jgi:hypothetical protein
MEEVAVMYGTNARISADIEIELSRCDPLPETRSERKSLQVSLSGGECSKNQIRQLEQACGVNPLRSNLRRTYLDQGKDS